MTRLDPRTKLGLGLMAIAAVFIAKEPKTLLVESIILLAALPLGFAPFPALLLAYGRVSLYHFFFLI
ncbi:MAG: hypothetical protein JRD00_02220 [Deltaproteobacteria bacterium]|nr:hypothetical protein [Deltaproteobacteria bacterium]